MKEVQVTKTLWEAWDGQQFPTAAECRAYEQSSLPQMLSGLTAAQVQAALDRANPQLADALERAGLAIRAARRKAGDFKRTPPPAPPPPVDRPPGRHYDPPPDAGAPEEVTA